jgi:hypothetical protein
VLSQAAHVGHLYGRPMLLLWLIRLPVAALTATWKSACAFVGIDPGFSNWRDDSGPTLALLWLLENSAHDLCELVIFSLQCRILLGT